MVRFLVPICCNKKLRLVNARRVRKDKYHTVLNAIFQCDKCGSIEETNIGKY